MGIDTKSLEAMSRGMKGGIELARDAKNSSLTVSSATGLGLPSGEGTKIAVGTKMEGKIGKYTVSLLREVLPEGNQIRGDYEYRYIGTLDGKSLTEEHAELLWKKWEPVQKYKNITQTRDAEQEKLKRVQPAVDLKEEQSYSETRKIVEELLR